MNEVLKKIQEIGILPVVVLEDAKDAKPLANALCEGGLPLAEVTFRTSAAKESIEIMSSQFPDMLVGAGTVLSVEQVKEAIKAGAKFIVSPGFDDEVVNYCLENNIPVTPGTCTPSDVQKCYKLGLEVVKFFPAEPSGGLNMIKAIAAPYTTIKFIPTGGIDLNNMSNYLSYEKIFAIGGSWMVKVSLVKNGEFDKIKQMTKEAVERVKEVRK
jgi:2-dehydro-3-deoxyphosphogluconate aldolase/4-hydroxy-2-oxoglutarate aldolase